MRVLYGLILLLAAAVSLCAQMEPCLAGTDTPQCGIVIALHPPSNPPDGNILSLPNEITIEVPVRIRATKVQLNSGPKGGQPPDFKAVSEAAKYKKSGNVERFQLKVESCPAADNTFQFKIISPKFPYPIVIDRDYECKPGSGQ